MSDSNDSDALHHAAIVGNLNEVQSLVQSGHPVNRFDDVGMTPLHYAAQGEHIQVVKFLLDAGADVNAHHELSIGNTPLAEVIEVCSVQLTDLLLNAGADPTTPGWMQLSALDRIRPHRRDRHDVYQLVVRAVRRLKRGET